MRERVGSNPTGSTHSKKRHFFFRARKKKEGKDSEAARQFDLRHAEYNDMPRSRTHGHIDELGARHFEEWTASVSPREN